MKIGFIADLHIDRSKTHKPDDFLYQLTRYIQDQGLQQLYIGGDISNHYGQTIQFVEKLQSLTSVDIYFIPGNHDLWEPAKEKKHTLAIYDIFKSHPQSLQNKSLMLNEDSAVIGHIAWYNHAYHAPRFTEDQLNRGQHKLVTWQDKRRLDWQSSDKEVSSYFTKETKTALDLLMTQHNPKNIILLTHMITVPDFTIPMPHRVFDFFNAYIATDDFLPFYDQYPIKQSIMGHVHIRHHIQKESQIFVSNSLGYEREWRKDNLYQEIAHAMYIIEI